MALREKARGSSRNETLDAQQALLRDTVSEGRGAPPRLPGGSCCLSRDRAPGLPYIPASLPLCGRGAALSTTPPGVSLGCRVTPRAAPPQRQASRSLRGCEVAMTTATTSTGGHPGLSPWSHTPGHRETCTFAPAWLRPFLSTRRQDRHKAKRNQDGSPEPR